MCSIIDIGHPFQKCNMFETLSTTICSSMFKKCLIVLRFKDGHSSNYSIFQEGSCLHQRVLMGVVPKIWFVVLEEYHIMHSKKWCAIVTPGFEPRMSISKSVLHIHWLPMFLHLFNTVFEKIHKQTKLPNLCPKPPKLPPVIPAFCHIFLHCFPMEPQAQSKT